MDDKVSRAICDRGNDLVAFLYGEADEREARDFEHHLQSCSACKEELSSFQQLRQSVGAWRQESLSAIPAYTSSLAVPGNSGNVELRKPSAAAAIRAFFDLSPLWVKGALAFAAVSFCVVSIFAVILFLETSQTDVVQSDKRYSEQELNAKVDQAVRATLEEIKAGKDGVPPLSVVPIENAPQATPNMTVSTSKLASDHPQAQRRPLTRSEKEQLAADLRLVSPSDESDLDLVSDKINN
jgi:putative zinc finger protein